MLAIPLIVLLCAGQDIKKEPDPVRIIEPVRVEAVLVPQGSIARLAMKKKTPLKQVANSNDAIILVSADPERTHVRMKALTPGISHLTLKGEDGIEEKILVIVEKKRP